MPSPNRKAVKSYLTAEEYDQVKALASQAGLSVSTYMKRVSLGQQVKSLTDQRALLAVMKANADLGRLGGLLKLALTDRERGGHVDYRRTLRQIEKSQAEVVAACREVVEGMTQIRQ